MSRIHAEGTVPIRTDSAAHAIADLRKIVRIGGSPPYGGVPLDNGGELHFTEDGLWAVDDSDREYWLGRGKRPPDDSDARQRHDEQTEGRRR